MTTERVLYHCDGDRFIPTTATRSPWHAGAQHGGPPAALAIRAIEAVADPAMDILRVTTDLLGEVPVEPLTVSAEVIRPGRKVALVTAEVRASQRAVVRSTAWLIRRAEPLALPPSPDPLPDPPAGPEALDEVDFGFRGYGDFFGDTLDKRLISGRLDAEGRAALWMRLRVPVIDGELATPMQQLVAMADSGNGISWALPLHRFIFVNTDVTISLLRPPDGDWFAMDSVSHVHPTGRGLTETGLYDRLGWLGRATQSLFVAESDAQPQHTP